MPRDPRPEIAEIVAGLTDDSAAMLHRSWPGGHGDVARPAAAEWVRRWTPARGTDVALAACGCATGRCTVCN
jgi:hypothetical protein